VSSDDPRGGKTENHETFRRKRPGEIPVAFLNAGDFPFENVRVAIHLALGRFEMFAII
jgi:hypothetical protein